jgi:hypothetical protein
MSSIYNSGCKAYLNGTSQYVAADDLYRTCLVLTKISTCYGLLTPCFVILCAIINNRLLKQSFFTKYYGRNYSVLTTRQQDTFRFHHIDLLAKITSLLFMSRPIFLVFVRGRSWFDPYYNNSSFTLGISASIGSSIVAALFIFHISSAETMRPLDLIHHLGAILAIQGYPTWSVSQPIDAVSSVVQARKVADICLLWSKSPLNDILCALPNTTLISRIRRCIQLHQSLRPYHSTLSCIQARRALQALYLHFLRWPRSDNFGGTDRFLRDVARMG